MRLKWGTVLVAVCVLAAAGAIVYAAWEGRSEAGSRGSESQEVRACRCSGTSYGTPEHGEKA